MLRYYFELFKIFPEIDNIDGIISCLSERIKTGVGKTNTSANKWKMPFMGKIIKANLLNDFAHLLTAY